MLKYIELACVALVFFGVPVLTYVINKWTYNNT